MQLFVVLSLAFAFAASWIVRSMWAGWRPRPRQGSAVPPGPPRLPILGNILQLGLTPHKSLAQLAKTYGPLMSLKLGTQLTVVVSSPEMAAEILHKHGHAFSNRSIPDSINSHGHDTISMTTLPAGSDRWKKLRRIAKERLFSNQALQRSAGQRRERLRKLAGHVSSCSEGGRAMNVGEATFTTMFNLVFATLFSVDLTQHGAADSAANKKFRGHVNAITRYIGVPNISDVFPIFTPLDLQGIRRKTKHHLGSLLEIVETMIEQRLQSRNASSSSSSSTKYQKQNDLLETMLDLIEGNEYDLSIKEIKHLFVDIIIAGSDSSAAATEWAMVELLLHPDKLAKLKAEMNGVIGEKRIVEESDIPRLPYLQATIKEVFRYHPVAPLLGPREAAEEARVNGYTIPKDTKIIVNFWAITRDPSVWKNPECFEPERFLDSDIDFGGQCPELIPFGAGRRICPGMPLASRMLHCMVATFCHNFDWKLKGGVGAESQHLQREDVFGMALQKKNPLWAIPIKT